MIAIPCSGGIASVNVCCRGVMPGERCPVIVTGIAARVTETAPVAGATKVRGAEVSATHVSATHVSPAAEVGAAAEMCAAAHVAPTAMASAAAMSATATVARGRGQDRQYEHAA
jgi:hypothetical protein